LLDVLSLKIKLAKT